MYQFLLVAIIGTMNITNSPQSTTADERRDKLSFAEMMEAEPDELKPIDNRYFMPVGSKEKAKHTFSGTLSIPASMMRTIPKVIKPAVIRGGETHRFPRVDIEFVTYENYLVPTERNIIRDLDGKSHWQIYRPIGIHHLTHNKTIESDGKPGVPHSGWGLYMTLDDIAKISKLLQNKGMHEGKQLLSKAKLAEALYQTKKRGLPTGESNKFGKKTYHMSLWHTPYRTENGRLMSVAEMHGWGGIIVVLMPNGITGFRIGNGGNQSLELHNAANHIRSFDGKSK